MSEDARALSRKNWTTETTIEGIKFGCLLRIADATEKMAQSYDTLIRDRDWYKNRYKEQQEAIKQLERRLAASRGVISRMKRKAQTTEVQP